MRRDTLLDLFDDFGGQRGTFLVYDDGYRSWSVGYPEVRRAADAFAARLDQTGLQKGDKIILWGENRPEWVVALWGALLRGVVVVPIDYRASADVLQRVRRIVKARVVLIGEEVSLAEAGDASIWRLRELLHPGSGTA